MKSLNATEYATEYQIYTFFIEKIFHEIRYYLVWNVLYEKFIFT